MRSLTIRFLGVIAAVALVRPAAFAQEAFTEVDLHRMMEHASNFRKDYKEGRWIIDTRFRQKAWEVIVEPLPDEVKLEVITAYEVWDDAGAKTR